MIPVLAPENWVYAEPYRGILGYMSECISAKVSEEVNGACSLTVVYPISGHLATEIAVGQLIIGLTSDGQETDLYRISRVTMDETQLEIYAPQVSDDLSKITVFPFAVNNFEDAVWYLNYQYQEWGDETIHNGKAMWDHGFHFEPISSDTFSGEFKVEVPKTIASLMTGGGSIAEVYGGEWRRRNGQIEFSALRGFDRGYVIRYGGNLVSAQQETNIADMYTGIAPYAKINNSVRTLSEGYIMASGNFPSKNILPVDLSSEFQSLPTEAQLRTKAVNYIRTHAIGQPIVSLQVGLNDFSGANKDAHGFVVGIGDRVTVIFPMMGIYTTARVTNIEYDVLNERPISINVGSKRQALAKTILNLGRNDTLTPIPSGWIEAETQPTKYFSSYTAGTSGTYFGKTGYKLYNSQGDYSIYWGTAYSTTYSGYRLADNSLATGYASASSDTAPWIGILLNKRLRYTTITISNRTGEAANVNGIKSGIVYGVNSESGTPEELVRFSNFTGQTAGQANSIQLMNEEPYYGYIVEVTDWYNKDRSSSHYLAIGEIQLNGQEEA